MESAGTRSAKEQEVGSTYPSPHMNSGEQKLCTVVPGHMQNKLSP